MLRKEQEIFKNKWEKDEEILSAIDLSIGDLFEDTIGDRIMPLFAVRQENKRQQVVQDKKSHFQLILDMGRDMRSNGIKLSLSELAEEKNAFMQLRGM